MQYKKLSPCIITDKLKECKDFYLKHFNAKLTFDCGWYINLYLENENTEFQFMEPQAPQHVVCNPAGLTYNLMVTDVDKVHEELTNAGITALEPLENHPWGDRGFAIQDPAGIILYIYTEIEPNEEFKKYYI